MDFDALTASLGERGFVVLERHLRDDALTEMLRLHAESIAAADPRDVSRSASGSNTRVHLTDHHPDLDRLYLDPALLELVSRAMGAPFRLNAFLSRTVHPGAVAQPLHLDCPHEGDAPAMIGFLYLLDDFRADNGATCFVPGSHRAGAGAEVVLATAPAGSLIVYDGAVLHGFSANTSATDRRSIQGSFVTRSLPPTRTARANPAAATSRATCSTIRRMPPSASNCRACAPRSRPAGIGGLPIEACPAPAIRHSVNAIRPHESCSGSSRRRNRARRRVATPEGIESHFWNVRTQGDAVEHIDLSWQQFPPGSKVQRFKLLDRAALGDSPATIARCELLLQRVLIGLAES